MVPADYTQMRLYRMVHFDNLEYIFRNGMCVSGHPKADPGYINIGDGNLIDQRKVYPVKIAPGGSLGDYVPFYFGGHSPMLLNIYTGYRGVTKRSQDEIAFIICSVASVIKHCPNWCFTDGHAKAAITKFYNRIEDLRHIDWMTVKQRFWNNDEDDWDRQRRKEAEFLVMSYVPKECIACVVVYDLCRKKHLETILERLQMNIAVFVDEKKRLYYP